MTCRTRGALARGIRCLAAIAALGIAVPQLALAQTPPARPDLAKARALVDSGQARQAYDMLLPFEPRLAGDKDFDYVFGIAAIDAGKPEQAVIALERVVLVDPLFAGAKLDLARAYFAVRNFDDAEREFKNVLDLGPPAAARAVVERYLAAIEEARRARRTQVTGYLEATVGFDDNVNNSTAAALVALPVFGGAQFTLAPTNVKTGDRFFAPGAGLAIRHGVSDLWSVYGGIDLKSRFNRSDTVFDQRSYDYNMGIERGDAQQALRLSLVGGRYDLDDKFNRRQNGLAAEYRNTLDASNQLSFFGQTMRYLFEKNLQANDFAQNVVGAAWSHVVDADRRVIALASAFAGSERDLHDRVDGGKGFRGLRLGGQFGVGSDVDIFGLAGAQHGNYRKKNAFFLRSRRDKVLELSVGATWRPSAGWTVRPQYAYTRNDSNIQLNDYERKVLSVTIRRDF